MAIALLALGIAFAAFCIWLTLRLVNGQKKLGWKLWATAGVIAVVGYPLSIGPACWITSRTKIGASLVTNTYGHLFRHTDLADPDPFVRKSVVGYSKLLAAPNSDWVFHIDEDDPGFTLTSKTRGHWVWHP
jgi:hypothetical protein